MGIVTLSWKKSMAIVKKNAKIYYLKPPVLIFGLLFPLFLFLAFSIGRGMDPAALVPGLLGMTVLFAASSVGPFIAPWERQVKTYERLLTSPVTLWHIVLGDVGAGFLYGLVISAVPLLLGLLVFGAQLVNPLIFVTTMLLSVYCFAALGSLLSALPTDQPSNVMMLSNLVRLPLLFISGVFLPLTEIPSWGLVISFLSPLTYTMELLRYSFGETPLVGAAVSHLVIAFYLFLFLFLSRLAHQQSIRRLF